MKKIARLLHISSQLMVSSVEIPEYLYHATYKPLIEQIKAHGLIKNATKQYEDSKDFIYLATDKNIAESYAETSDIVPEKWLDEIIILKVATKNLNHDKLTIDQNIQHDEEITTYQYNDNIPFSNLEIENNKTANIENQSLTLDQARFTLDSLKEIKNYLGTTNIDVISKKDDPIKYEKYYKLYENHPAKQIKNRKPSFVTGMKEEKNIGGQIILIWRDAQVNDWLLTAPKGFLKTLETSLENKGRLNIVASSSATETDREEKKNQMKKRIEETVNRNRKRFDDFYKRHDLSPDQEPKDIAIMIPGSYSDKYSIVSPSSKSKGKWQLTYFDEKGPWGDQTHNNLDEALKQTSTKNLNKAEVMKGQQSRLQIASLALFYMGKIKLAAEWHELPESDDLEDLLWALYELEFKYSMMKNKPEKWEGSPQRYDNTLNKMEQKLLIVNKNIADKLLPVYKSWINSHAITKPKQWAKARYNDANEIDEDSIFEGLKGEYKRYGNRDINEEIREITSENINHMPKLKNFLEEFAEEEKNRIEEDEYEEDEYEEDEYNEKLEYYDDLENVWDSIMSSYDVSEFINHLMPPRIGDELYQLWYEKIVFPVWYKHWKAKGIDATRKRVEQRFKELKSLSSGSITNPGKASGLTNMAIQESHQTGQMMEYIEQYHDISSNILESLTNTDTSEWDKELNTMGLKAASIKIASEEEIQLPTLDEFLKGNIRNSFLNIPGFDKFYARKGSYYIDGKIIPKVFQIANLEATEKGKGTFSKLIKELKKKGMPIFVESILNPRLPGKLEELGFKQVNKDSGLHYFWENK